MKRISKPLSLGIGVAMCTFDGGTRILHILAHVRFLVCLLTNHLPREKSSHLPRGLWLGPLSHEKRCFLGGDLSSSLMSLPLYPSYVPPSLTVFLPTFFVLSASPSSSSTPGCSQPTREGRGCSEDLAPSLCLWM